VKCEFLTRVHTLELEQNRRGFLHDNFVGQLRVAKGEHYCSDLSTPGLLRSELTWCAGVSARVCVRVHTQHEARKKAQR